MQCNQPFWCFGVPNNTQFPPYLTQPCYPEVIGEGDVMSITLPNGSVQSYFVPVNRRNRWKPSANPDISNIMPVWPNCNNEAWFVRNILNTNTASGPNRLVFNYSGDPSYPIINSPLQNYIQKFHNDGWTSTTDLHYFYPCLPRDWIIRSCTGVQVELLKEDKPKYHCGTLCSRPCYCKPKICGSDTETNSENCCSETPMSVDDIDSENLTQCCCDKKSSRKKDMPSKKNKNHSCACHSSHIEKIDKSVTTYTDQAINCTDKKGRGRCNQKKRKKNDGRSLKRDYLCESACCLGSPCSDSDQNNCNRL